MTRFPYERDSHGDCDYAREISHGDKPWEVASCKNAIDPCMILVRRKSCAPDIVYPGNKLAGFHFVTKVGTGFQQAYRLAKHETSLIEKALKDVEALFKGRRQDGAEF